MIIVSACLAGIQCRYDGKSDTCDYIEQLVKSGEAVPVCPELLGGLKIPRVPAEKVITDGIVKIVNKEGIDVTQNFIDGAEKTLEIARIIGAETAVLKAKSPSCGNKFIYDGTFAGKLIKGRGITAEMLERNGIKVYNENEAEELINEKKQF